ncbi:aldehyde dehydrogenase family protein [Zobellella iuensis]|uniref:Aldehyde dehydrogenase family protein n=1 Tax=Zobellella iuensis TaxID=2803811 RepID=A0ABS1QX85_9GAMM|nr:aldehyde dehydrogenase family protein [Zobellella iuensis]MBL1379482.1 aldehyde dehydrogenase family protein [Zobellella iuensis]
MTFISFNPATGQQNGVFETLSASRLEGCLQQSGEAAERWRQSSFAERAALLNRLAALLSANRERLALCVTREMGKLLSESLAEVDCCARECAYFAAHGQAMLPLARSLTTFEPLGTVLLLGSWRFPLWQLFRMLAPTLMAGNAVLLKLAENLPLCAREIEALVREAEVPEGLVASLAVDKARVAELIRDPRVQALGFSGNRADGARLSALAAQQLKPVALELDQAEWQLVLDDADLELAVEAALHLRFSNAGQHGVGAGSFMVTPAIADDFVALLATRLAACQPGHPEDLDSRLAPLATRPLREELHRQLTAAVDEGARLVAGGVLPESDGWYYPASLLDGVTPAMALFRGLPSGPLAAVVRVRDAEQMGSLCRGLGAHGGARIWTRDLVLGEQLARRLPFGRCLVNQAPGRAYPPGAAVDGHFNIKAFCRMKSLLISV